MTDRDPATPADDEAESRRRRSHGVKFFLRDLVLVVVAAVVISVGIKAFLVRSFYIPSASMQNTLQIDDRILVNELVPRMVPLQHGDVVVFTDPGGWLGSPPVEQRNSLAAGIDWVLSAVGLSASDSNDHLVKRVIGLPGDTVVCCNAFGQMSVNGIPLDEPYLTLENTSNRVTPGDFSVTVPKDSLWVMGDNRYNSSDSAYHYLKGDAGKGFVPTDRVVGRAFVISWPTSRWTWLDNYPKVFGGVDGAGR